MLDAEANEAYVPVTARPASRPERARLAAFRAETPQRRPIDGHPNRSPPAPIAGEAEFRDTHDVIDDATFGTPIRLNVGAGGEAVELFIETGTPDLSRTIAAEIGVPWEERLELWPVERRGAERERRTAAARHRESA